MRLILTSCRLEELGRRIPSLQLVEDADLLPRRELERLKSTTARLVVAAHRPGLLPTLHECRTSPVLLREIVAWLVGPEAVARLPLEAVYARHRGDVRKALRELYDLAS